MARCYWVTWVTWGTWVICDGVVTEFRDYRERSSTLRRATMAAPMVTFRTADGQVVASRHPVPSLPAAFAKGVRLRSYNNPDTPRDAVVPAGLALLSLGWGSAGAAGLALVVTPGLFLRIAALPWMERQRARPSAHTAAGAAPDRPARLNCICIQPGPVSATRTFSVAIRAMVDANTRRLRGLRPARRPGPIGLRRSKRTLPRCSSPSSNAGIRHQTGTTMPVRRGTTEKTVAMQSVEGARQPRT